MPHPLPDATIPSDALIAIAHKTIILTRGLENLDPTTLPGTDAYVAYRTAEIDGLIESVFAVELAVKCLLQAADLPSMDTEEMMGLIRKWRNAL